MFDLAESSESPNPLAGASNRHACTPIDKAGNRSRLPLSWYSPLQPPIDTGTLKAEWLSSFPESEVVFQGTTFPLGEFLILQILDSCASS